MAKLKEIEYGSQKDKAIVLLDEKEILMLAREEKRSVKEDIALIAEKNKISLLEAYTCFLAYQTGRVTTEIDAIRHNRTWGNFGEIL